MKRRSMLAGVLAAALVSGAAPGLAPAEPLESGDDTADDPLGAERIAAAVDGALRSGEHAFCRRADYELKPGERALCTFAEPARERCPEFARACARTAEVLPASELELGSALMSALRNLGFVLFWCLIGALVALGASLLYRVLRARSLPDAGEAPPPKPASEERAAEAGFERDAALHLSRSRALAASGDFAAALLELHLAVVLSLDARGLIVARRGRTNGDYARELRAIPELGAAFREVTGTTEAVHFGGRSIDAPGFERLMARAGSLLGGVVLAVSLLSGAVACNGESHVRRASDVCGTRADGYSVLCGLFELSGDVRRRYRSLDQIEDEVTRIVVFPNSLDESSWAALSDWVIRGGLAVLTTPAGSLDARFGVERDGKPCDARIQLTVPNEPAPLATLGNALGTPPLEPDALCSSGDVYVGHGSLGAGRVVFVPAPELLSNASLAAGDNARLLLSLMPSAEGRTDLVGAWTGSASANPFESMHAARLWPWLAQLSLLGLAFTRLRGAPFGRRSPPPENSRRRFSEHVRALGERWAEAGASRSALAAYATWAFEVLRERVPSGTERSIAELARVVSSKTGRPDIEVTQTLALARVAQSEPYGTGLEADDLATLGHLGKLLQELGGPR